MLGSIGKQSGESVESVLEKKRKATVVISAHLPTQHTRCSTHTRTTLGDGSFAVAGPRVWNSLPAAIRQITSYGQFRQHLKTRLFGA